MQQEKKQKEQHGTTENNKQTRKTSYLQGPALWMRCHFSKHHHHHVPPGLRSKRRVELPPRLVPLEFDPFQLPFRRPPLQPARRHQSHQRKAQHVAKKHRRRDRQSKDQMAALEAFLVDVDTQKRPGQLAHVLAGERRERLGAQRWPDQVEDGDHRRVQLLRNVGDFAGTQACDGVPEESARHREDDRHEGPGDENGVEDVGLGVAVKEAFEAAVYEEGRSEERS